MKRNRIFYVEDEPSLGKIVCDTLERQGYVVDWETDGAKVISAIGEKVPDVCVLDIMLPNIDGYSLCRTIRGLFPDLPVIFLTAKTGTSDLVLGFESGGTDYIRKPFSIEELIARIENQLRLLNGTIDNCQAPDHLEIGSSVLSVTAYELRTPASVYSLSNRDMQILKMLYANRNGITSRKDLLMAVWGDDSYFNSRNLDVYIKKLRGYFSYDDTVRIITLKGSGYLFIIQ